MWAYETGFFPETSKMESFVTIVNVLKVPRFLQVKLPSYVNECLHIIIYWIFHWILMEKCGEHFFTSNQFISNYPSESNLLSNLADSSSETNIIKFETLQRRFQNVFKCCFLLTGLNAIMFMHIVRLRIS